MRFTCNRCYSLLYTRTTVARSDPHQHPDGPNKFEQPPRHWGLVGIYIRLLLHLVRCKAEFGLPIWLCKHTSLVTLKYSKETCEVTEHLSLVRLLI